MFKRKKFMALCATTLAGISAFGSLAPMAASADVAKNGETVVTYESAPKPAEWGLSVPSTIRLDKVADSGDSRWGTGKLEIVSEDGSTFQDKTKDRTFSIDGEPAHLSPDNKDVFMIFKDGVTSSEPLEKCSVYIKTLDQGATELTAWPEQATTSISALKNIEIVSMSNNSKSPSRILGLKARCPYTIIWRNNLTNTIQWTATEKTS
ncbi:hypothetical protein [Lactococcus lactis]|uniref:Uncharacterized protein n=1 Tax=Lactococcus lactis TaxID=1358 RepID=A0AAW5TMP6_9LACT|nr:hypothetical protein [Lactococcus lactis]MCW2280409.1 hypothetical protein [Lactococcus lactis]